MSRFGFEPTILVFERENAVHALDASGPAATLIGAQLNYITLIVIRGAEPVDTMTK
jgi:hypothetical protein